MPSPRTTKQFKVSVTGRDGKPHGEPGTADGWGLRAYSVVDALAKALAMFTRDAASKQTDAAGSDLVVETDTVDVTIIRTPDGRHKAVIYSNELGEHSSVLIRPGDGDAPPRLSMSTGWTTLPIGEQVENAIYEVERQAEFEALLAAEAKSDG